MKRNETVTALGAALYHVERAEALLEKLRGSKLLELTKEKVSAAAYQLGAEFGRLKLRQGSPAVESNDWVTGALWTEAQRRFALEVYKYLFGGARDYDYERSLEDRASERAYALWSDIEDKPHLALNLIDGALREAVSDYHERCAFDEACR